MKILRRIFSLLFAALASIIFIWSGVIAWGYIVKHTKIRDFTDWFLLLIPVVVPFVAFIISCFVFFLKTQHKVVRGMVFGAFSGGNLYVLLQMYTLVNNHELIASDGTAYWGSMEMPTFYIGIPAILLMSMIGALIGYGINRLNS
jgi:hypothetical protein